MTDGKTFPKNNVEKLTHLQIGVYSLHIYVEDVSDGLVEPDLSCVSAVGPGANQEWCVVVRVTIDSNDNSCLSNVASSIISLDHKL